MILNQFINQLINNYKRRILEEMAVSVFAEKRGEHVLKKLTQVNVKKKVVTITLNFESLYLYNLGPLMRSDTLLCDSTSA